MFKKYLIMYAFTLLIYGHTICAVQVDIKMLPVNGGTFVMGESNNIFSADNITITNGFYLGQYEVSQLEYQRILDGKPGVNSTPSHWHGHPNRPVESVSFEDIKVFLGWLNDQTKDTRPSGYFFTLPTEAEWEYACRAGTTTAYSWGDSISANNANYNGNIGETTDVGQYAQNPWGFYDMHGNVKELTADKRASNPYPAWSGPQTLVDPVYYFGSQHPARGGGHYDLAWGLRSGVVFQSGFSNNFKSHDCGFRLALKKLSSFKDIEYPLINLFGGSTIVMKVGDAWIEPGYSVIDERDGNLSNMVNVNGFLNTDTVGSYSLTYSVSDLSGNLSQVTREVKVVPQIENHHLVHLSPSDSMEMLWVDRGDFKKGSPESESGRFSTFSDYYGYETQHEVTLTSGFFLGKYEVTQREYQLVMDGVTGDLNSTPSHWHGNPNRPVENVSFEDITIFLERLNNLMNDKIPEGWQYTLPTEAEWEYACRAGTTTAYSWGDSISASNANYNGNIGETTDVGQYAPNPWGFYDMHGNVGEWTSDRMVRYYGESKMNPVSHPTSTQPRVYRGGDYRTLEKHLRSASRLKEPKSKSRSADRGFRLSFKQESDTESPVLKLFGEETVILNAGDSWNEPGYSAIDEREGNLTSTVSVNGFVDVSVPGVYFLHYSASDAVGNTANTLRTVKIRGEDFIIPPSQGKVIYVDDNASEDGDGSSWANAYRYLQDAITNSNYGDEIWVAEGLYKPWQRKGIELGTSWQDTEYKKTSSFNLKSGVTIYGGFTGSEKNREPLGDPRKTILSGGNYCFTVVTAEKLESKILLSRFLVTGGDADQSVHPYTHKSASGGGIYIENSELILNELFISDNKARNYGAGVFISNSSVHFEKCEITKCLGSLRSSVDAVKIYDSNVSFNWCEIHSNQDQAVSAIKSQITFYSCQLYNNVGSAVDSMTGMISFEECSIFDNKERISYYGFGKSSSTPVPSISSKRSGALILSNSVITNNAGAGIEATKDYTLIRSCEITKNRGSGIILDEYTRAEFPQNATIESSVIAYNESRFGGGVNLGEVNTYFYNSIISNNISTISGGGIYAFTDDLIVTNCTITQNQAPTDMSTSRIDSGGIKFTSPTSRYTGNVSNKIILTNNIIWHNIDSSSSNIDHGIYLDPGRHEIEILQITGDGNSIVNQADHNIIENWTSSPSGLDPNFVNIYDPDGPDDVWFTKDDGLRIKSGSSAVDAGSNYALPAYINGFDADGNQSEPNPFDVSSNTRIVGQSVDIGAYEYDVNTPPPEALKILIEVNASSGGTVTPSDQYLFNEPAVIVAKANDGYTFSNWSGDNNSTEPNLSFSVRHEMSLKANFTEDLNDDDSDGISNFDEIIIYKTDSSLNDSDGDGLSDYSELNIHLTDPRKKDTDDDGVSDINDVVRIKLSDVLELGNGWRKSNTFGVFYISDKHWIYHSELHWIFPGKTLNKSNWLYSDKLSWFWTNLSEGIWPYIWHHQSESWMYFQSGHENPRFYHYGTKKWMTLE